MDIFMPDVFPSTRFASMRFLLACVLVSIGAGSARAGYFEGRHYPIVTDAMFTADEFILDQARFWYSIYAEVGDDEGLLHDPFYPDMVFRKVRAPGQGRPASKLVDVQVRALREEIRAMLAKDTATWTAEERAVKAVFPSFWDSTAIMLSVERIRFQRGLKGKFRAGLERSYRYLPLIDSILKAEGVPDRLKYLPHVESSFYPYAYSKVGAAGMWQFMKSSGKHFKLKIGYQVDERRDPHASTQAAARMLAGNFARLKSWPLAIVAYNHGPGGLARAARQTGTRDLGTIIKSYYSNSFGFASKNFYAEFLAASSIALKADSLYPDLRKMEPLQFHQLVLAKPLGTRFLSTVTGLSPAELEEYNLGLRPAIFRGNAQLPKGFVLKLPYTVDIAAIAAKLGSGDALASRSANPLPSAPVSVAVAMAAKASAGPPSPSVTDTLSEATLPMTMAHDKVGNRQGETDPLAGVAPSKRKRAKKGAKPEKPVPQSTLSAAISASEAQADVPVGREAPPAMAASGRPKVAPPSAALPPTASALTLPSIPAAAAPATLVDPTLALQASDMDKLAHPMDRFNPSIYRLDYTYADGALNIQAGTEETLSHYAEWALVPEKTLRRINKIKSARDFRLGRRIRIPLAEEKAQEFVKRREENYRAMEEDFYGNYYVSLTEPFKVEKGLNLWAWAQEREIPFWLLQKHNPGKTLNELRPGDTLSLPVIETGVRKWGFTRYSSSKEYLSGISRFLASGKPEAY